MASNVDGLLKKDTKDLLALAKLAEVAERYSDMCKFMHKLFTEKCKNAEAAKDMPTIDERNLLSVAYKNVVGSKRQSWRTLSAPSQFETSKDKIANYTAIVESELETVCNEVLNLLKNGPVKQVEDDLANPDREKTKVTEEDGVFYLKMCGDYYRYLAEIQPNNEKHQTSAAEYYTKAMDLAEKKLPETHPTRLGLALNFSVCYYEILGKRKEACDLAKKAFDAAIEKLDTLNDASYKDSTLIMQLLRDNLTLWTTEKDDGDKDTAEPQG